MEIGASIFFTDYSIAPTELAVALEERGFDSLWVAEHSHIPVTRRFSLPGGMELSKQYYDVIGPVRHIELGGGRHHAAKTRGRRAPRIARRTARRKAPPTMTGGCGFCTGLGQVIIGGKSTIWP